MSHISYAFNHSDIEATAYALTVLPRLGLAESEAQAEINYHLCCSAAKKFINHADRYYTRQISYHYCSTPGCQPHHSCDIEVDPKAFRRIQEFFFLS